MVEDLNFIQEDLDRCFRNQENCKLTRIDEDEIKMQVDQRIKEFTEKHKADLENAGKNSMSATEKEMLRLNLETV